MALPFPNNFGAWAAPIVSVLVLGVLAFALQVVRCLALFLVAGGTRAARLAVGRAALAAAVAYPARFADRSAQRILGVAR